MGGGPGDGVRTRLLLLVYEACDLLAEEVVDGQGNMAGLRNIIADVRGWVKGIGVVLMQDKLGWYDWLVEVRNI